MGTALTWVAARADGVLVVGAEDGTLRLVDARSAAVLQTKSCGDFVARVVVLPDGRLVVARLDGRVLVLDGDARTTLHEFDTGHGRLRGLAAHGTGNLLATCGEDGAVRTWQGPAWTKGLELVDGKVAANAVGFAGDFVVAGYADGFAVAWTADGTQKVTSRRVLNSAVYSLGVHPAGDRIVFGGNKGGMASLAVGPPGEWVSGDGWRTPPPPIAVNAIAFATDGRFVAACSDGAARLVESMQSRVDLDVGTPFWLRKPKPEWNAAFIVSGACFVPGTDWIATSHFDGHVRWWRERQLVGELAPPPVGSA